MQDIRRYIVRETMISFLANGLVNSFVVWVVFDSKSEVSLFGFGGMAMDFVPQLGAITLVGSLIPALLTRCRLGKGKISQKFLTVAIEPAAILRNSVVAAACVILGLGLSTTAILACLWPGPYTFAQVFAIKSIVGCLVPFIITPRAIGWVLQR